MSIRKLLQEVDFDIVELLDALVIIFLPSSSRYVDSRLVESKLKLINY